MVLNLIFLHYHNQANVACVVCAAGVIALELGAATFRDVDDAPIPNSASIIYYLYSNRGYIIAGFSGDVLSLAAIVSVSHPVKNAAATRFSCNVVVTTAKCLFGV